MKYLLLFLVPFLCQAEFSSQGEISFEYRRFQDDKVKSSIDMGLSLFSRVESRYEDGPWKNAFRAMSRIDRKDDSRNFLNLEDAYFSYTFLPEEESESESETKFLAGYKVFNWTALEGFHPADRVNSRNFDSNIEKLEKFGELVVEMETTFFEGTFTLLFMPRPEDPLLPGAHSRLGAGSDIDPPRWVKGNNVNNDDAWNPQFGARITQFIFDADISFHVLKHYDRFSPIVGANDFSFNNFLQVYLPSSSLLEPHYFETTQLGSTLQLPIFEGVFKFEGAYRDYDNNVSLLTLRGIRSPIDHSDFAIGYERTFEHEGGYESTLFIEGQRTFGTSKQRRSELNIFQSDLLLGWRFVFNDLMGKEIFLSSIVDTERSHEILASIKYEQRLSDVWKISTGLRYYDAPQKGQLPTNLESLHKDNYIFVTLSRFF